jgi:hypothetical protein
MATRFRENDFAHVWGDGATVTDLVAVYPTPSSFLLAGFDNVGGGKPARLTIRGLYLFPPTVTPAQMADYVTRLPA